MKNEIESFKSGKDKVKTVEFIDEEVIDFSGISIRRNAFKVRDRFIKEFDVVKLLRVTEEQEKLFALYFTRYIVLKQGLEINRELGTVDFHKRPDRSRIEFLEERNSDSERVAGEIMQEIDEQAGIVGESACRIESAANTLSNIFLNNLKGSSRKRKQEIRETSSRITI